VVNAVEEMVSKGVEKGAAEAFRRGRREEGYTEFTAEEKGVVGVGETVGGVVADSNLVVTMLLYSSNVSSIHNNSLHRRDGAVAAAARSHR
jgi:hypothetical protein